jgi:hypothetical protein
MQKVLVTFKNGYKMPGFRTPGNMIVYPLSFVCEVLGLDYNYWQRKGVTSGSTGNISWFTDNKLKDFLIGLSKNISKKSDKIQKEYNHIRIAFIQGIQDIKDIEPVKTEDKNKDSLEIENLKAKVKALTNKNKELEDQVSFLSSENLRHRTNFDIELEKVTELEKENRFLAELLQEWKAHHQAQLNGLRNFYMLEMKELEYNYKSLLEKLKKTLEGGNNDK